jgi:hypothetical protein
MRQGGSKSSGVPNVLGLRVPANAKPSGLPATMLSGIVLSVCVGMVASIIFMVLTRQRRMTDAVRAELYSRMFEAMRMKAATNTAMMARFERAQKRLKYVEERQRKAVAANAWINKPFNLPQYLPVYEYVLLGKVLGNEYATFDDAKTACNDTQYATHIQLDTRTGRAVIKTILENPESFGKSAQDTITSMTKKCGEGYHKSFITYIHPRLFLLNEANRTFRRDWVDLTMADFEANQQAQEKRKASLNGQCMLGTDSGTCKWKQGWKKALFDYILPLATAIITEGISQAFFQGLKLIPALIAEASVVVADVTAQTVVQRQLTKAEENEAEQLARRFELIKNRTSLSNAHAGGKESYFSIVERLHLPECSEKDEYSFIRKFYANRRDVTNVEMRNAAPYQFSLLDKLAAYEKLEADYWNCDEITQHLQVSKTMGKVLYNTWGITFAYGGSGYVRGGGQSLIDTYKTSNIVPVSFQIHPSGNLNACADADAKFSVEIESQNNFVNS